VGELNCGAKVDDSTRVKIMTASVSESEADARELCLDLPDCCIAKMSPQSERHIAEEIKMR
jgi:hypothetical protein